MKNDEARVCPHCYHSLTLQEAIAILHGSSFQETVRVKLPDGTVALIEAGQVNPNEVEILDA